MTRKETIEVLKANYPSLKCFKQLCEAVDMAIKALEQEPCDDCISREAVLEILGNYGCTNREGLLFRDIKELPSVKPKVDVDALINKIETELSWRLVDIIREWAERSDKE